MNYNGIENSMTFEPSKLGTVRTVDNAQEDFEEAKAEYLKVAAKMSANAKLSDISDVDLVLNRLGSEDADRIERVMNQVWAELEAEARLP